MKTLCLSSVMFLGLLFIRNSPRAHPIQLDGVIKTGEWDGAKERGLAGGGKVLTKFERNVLFVALVGNKKAWSHLYLVNADTVRVLHASAALGEARYVRQQALWRPITTFQWQLREKEYTAALESKQQNHFAQHGWVANNNNLGNGMVFEFKVDLSRTGNNSRWACVLAEIPFDLHHFPADLKDDTILPRLIQGYTPDSLRFNIDSWSLGN